MNNSHAKRESYSYLDKKLVMKLSFFFFFSVNYSFEGGFFPMILSGPALFWYYMDLIYIYTPNKIKLIGPKRLQNLTVRLKSP